MPNKKLVVLGGSFNPPTLAHKTLLETVMNRINADNGIYVPSSEFYVNRKCERNHTPFKFTQNERLNMLKSLCIQDVTSVSTCEYDDTTKGRTHTTLLQLQKEYPKHSIYFIMGSDKLTIFPKWKLSNMLDQFRIIIIPREDDNPAQLIASNIKLAAHWESFLIMDKIKDHSEVSSSKVQMLYANKNYEQAMNHVSAETHKIIMQKLLTNVIANA